MKKSILAIAVTAATSFGANAAPVDVQVDKFNAAMTKAGNDAQIVETEQGYAIVYNDQNGNPVAHKKLIGNGKEFKAGLKLVQEANAAERIARRDSKDTAPVAQKVDAFNAVMEKAGNDARIVMTPQGYAIQFNDQNGNPIAHQKLIGNGEDFTKGLKDHAGDNAQKRQDNRTGVDPILPPEGIDPVPTKPSSGEDVVEAFNNRFAEHGYTIESNENGSIGLKKDGEWQYYVASQNEDGTYNIIDGNANKLRGDVAEVVTAYIKHNNGDAGFPVAPIVTDPITPPVEVAPIYEGGQEGADKFNALMERAGKDARIVVGDGTFSILMKDGQGNDVIKTIHEEDFHKVMEKAELVKEGLKNNIPSVPEYGDPEAPIVELPQPIGAPDWIADKKAELKDKADEIAKNIEERQKEREDKGIVIVDPIKDGNPDHGIVDGSKKEALQAHVDMRKAEIKEAIEGHLNKEEPIVIPDGKVAKAVQQKLEEKADEIREKLPTGEKPELDGKVAKAVVAKLEEKADEIRSNLPEGEKPELDGKVAEGVAKALTERAGDAYGSIEDLYAAQSAENDMRFDDVYKQLGELEDKIDGVAAMNQAALTARPYLGNGQTSAVGVGLGQAGSESAVAIGYAQRINENWTANANVAIQSGDAETAIGAGLSYAW